MHGSRALGLAFDIGTTTIAGSLVDMETSKRLNRLSEINPQIAMGRDVLSRIAAIEKDGNALHKFHKSLFGALNRMTEQLLCKNGKQDDVVKVVFAGNPVMEHLFLSMSPLSIGRSPYRPFFKKGKMFKAQETLLNVNADASVYVFPLIGGFVGGDTVALILYTGLYKGGGVRLAIDVGTNTEIVLGREEDLWVTSAPAGPAFEGGGIKNGMIAEKGAISKVKIQDDTIEIQVIGGGRPIGICGSGLLSALSEMLKAGIVKGDGGIRHRDEIESNIANRVHEIQGERSFTLYRDAKSNVAITQADIRELQLAKAAIQSGIKILLKRKCVGFKDIEEVIVTGAFGNNIKTEHLEMLGIIPGAWLNKVSFIKDAPLMGAEQALVSGDAVKIAEDVHVSTHYVALSGNPVFEKTYFKAMDFNNKNFWEA